MCRRRTFRIAVPSNNPANLFLARLGPSGGISDCAGSSVQCSSRREHHLLGGGLRRHFRLGTSVGQGPLWIKGMIAGLCAMMLAWFVFLPIMGHPAAFAWQPFPMLRSCVAYQMWG